MQSLAILLVAGNSTITSRKCHMPDLACPSVEENALLEFVRVTMPTARLRDEQKYIGIIWSTMNPSRPMHFGKPLSLQL